MKTCNECEYFFWICERGEIDILRCKCRENGKRFEFRMPNIPIVTNEKGEKELKLDIPVPDWCFLYGAKNRGNKSE